MCQPVVVPKGSACGAASSSAGQLPGLGSCCNARLVQCCTAVREGGGPVTPVLLLLQVLAALLFCAAPPQLGGCRQGLRPPGGA